MNQVLRLDGSTPVKYGLRLPMDATYDILKERLFPLCNVPSDHLLLAEVSGAMIKVIFIAKANFLKIQRICHLLIFRRRIFRLEEAKCVQRLV